MMEYKGYTGRVTAVDAARGVLHGEVADITDVVTFQGRSPEELVGAFRDSVDDYLAFCEERSEAPDKPFSGKFLVRIPPALHRQASSAAKAAGESMNAWVVAAIKTSVEKALPNPRATPRQDIRQKDNINRRAKPTTDRHQREIDL